MVPKWPGAAKAWKACEGGPRSSWRWHGGRSQEQPQELPCACVPTLPCACVPTTGDVDARPSRATMQSWHRFVSLLWQVVRKLRAYLGYPPPPLGGGWVAILCGRRLRPAASPRRRAIRPDHPAHPRERCRGLPAGSAPRPEGATKHSPASRLSDPPGLRGPATNRRRGSSRPPPPTEPPVGLAVLAARSWGRQLARSDRRDRRAAPSSA